MRILFAIIGVCLCSGVVALEITLNECIGLNIAITDIEFIDQDRFLVSGKSGELVLVQACGAESRRIGKLKVSSHSELGLLGVALGDLVPEDAAEGARDLFLYYSPKQAQTLTRLSRFDFSPSSKDLALVSEQVLLEIEQPYSNHDGGALKIGPDKMLYVGIGDGGSGGDPLNHGQQPNTLLGSILRVVPNRKSTKAYDLPKGNLQDFVSGAAPEILAMGLRNPWKFAFDSKGSLIIADVGQNKIEEISIVPGEYIGKRKLNLGWRLKEGKACFNPRINCDKDGLLGPVYQYNRDMGTSITGGETLKFNGVEYYSFADFGSGLIGIVNVAKPGDLLAHKKNPGKAWTTFGKSPTGKVLIANIKGEIYQLELRD